MSLGDPATDCLHGRDEGAAGDHRHQGKQDRRHECKYKEWMGDR